MGPRDRHIFEKNEEMNFEKWGEYEMEKRGDRD